MDRDALPALLGCGLGLAFLFVVLLVSLVIGLFVCYQLYVAARQLPLANRKLAPGLVFLLFVPLLNLVWLFVVVMKISQGYQEYFAANPRPGVGDCGYGIGLGWAISAICVFVPLVRLFAGLAALILMILYLVKLSQMRALVAPTTAS
jgi:hypothetical protein